MVAAFGCGGDGHQVDADVCSQENKAPGASDHPPPSSPPPTVDQQWQNLVAGDGGGGGDGGSVG